MFCVFGYVGFVLCLVCCVLCVARRAMVVGRWVTCVVCRVLCVVCGVLRCALCVVGCCLLVVGCWLSFVDCRLLDVGCSWSCVVRCGCALFGGWSLCIVRCWLLVVLVLFACCFGNCWCALCVVCGWVFVVVCWVFIACNRLLVVDVPLLFDDYCSSFVVGCVLFNVCVFVVRWAYWLLLVVCCV